MSSPQGPDQSQNEDLKLTRALSRATETRDSQGDTSTGSKGRPEEDPSIWIGRQLGKYRITEVLGVGGMGVVLRGHDATLERDVAIKILPQELSDDSVALNRFLTEARSAGKLNHPNTITLYEFGQEGSTHYQVMEVVTGGSIDDQLADVGRYSIAEATRITMETCRGLSAAHQAGLVHRDIKPSNLLLTQDGVVKISDFGLAKRTQTQTMQVTRVGQIVGTPYYMSPEQCQSQDVDPRSDIYSLGATYYSLLTGKTPFADSDSVVQVMYAHCNATPPNPCDMRSEVPFACATLIERAMAKKPDDRYASADEMRQDLEAILASLSGTGFTSPTPTSVTPQPSGPSTADINPNTSAMRNLTLVAVSGLVLACAILGGFFLLAGKSRATADLPQNGAATDNGNAKVIPPPTGTPIKVGILHSLTGTMSGSEQPVMEAVQLAIEELNTEGGLLGRPVEGIIADGRSNSDTFAEEAKRLIGEDEVVTVFGCWTSASRKTVVPIFEEANHLLVYPVQYEGVEQSPNVIYLGATPNQQIIPALRWFYGFQNKKRFFIVGSDYVFPRVASEIIRDQIDELNAELVGDAFLPLGSVDVKPIVEKIKETKPDLILNLINGDTNTVFFRELHQQGIMPQDIPTVSFSIGEAELQHLDTTKLEGDFAASNYFQSVDTAENRLFVERFKQRYGERRVITDAMEAAYIGVKLWARAVDKCKSTDPPAIRDAMLEQSMQSPGGLVSIDAQTQHLFKTPRIGKIRRDGQFDIEWVDVKPQAPMPYPESRSPEQWNTLLEELYSGWGGRWSAPL